MHRSGTSALSGLLLNHGLNAGANLLESTKYNAQGYFENPNIVKLNDELLEWSNATWDVPYYIRDINKDRFNEFADQLDSILLNGFGSAEEIILKDPRISILLPWYKQYFKNRGIKVVYVCALRNPACIASSLQKRNGFSYEKSLRLWHFYMCRVLNDMLHEDVYFLEFEKLLEADTKTIKPLLRELRKHGYVSIQLASQGDFAIDSSLVTRKNQKQSKLGKEITEFYRSILTLAIQQFIALEEPLNFVEDQTSGIEIAADIAKANSFAYSRLILKPESKKYIEPISQLIDIRDHSHSLIFQLGGEEDLAEISWNPIIGSWNELALLKATFITKKEEELEAKILKVNGVELTKNLWRFETGNSIISFNVPDVSSLARLELSFTLNAFSLADIELSFHERSHEFRAHIDHLNAELGNFKTLKAEINLLKDDLERQIESTLSTTEKLEKLKFLNGKLERQSNLSNKLNSAFLDQIENLSQERLFLENEVISLKDEEAKRETLIVRFQELGHALTGHITSLEEELVEREKEVNLYFDEYDKQVSQLEAIISQERKQALEVVTRLTRLEAVISEERKETREVVSKLTRLEGVISKERKETREVVKQVSRLEDIISDERKENLELVKQVSRLENLISEERKENHELVKQVSRIEDLNSEERKENLEVVKQISGKLESLSRARNSLVQDLKISQESKKRLDQERTALEASFSYQMGRFLTWPFRVFFKFLNRVKIFRSGFLLVKMGLLVFSRPRQLLANLNAQNFKTLLRAIKHENPDELQKNIGDKLGITDSKEDHLVEMPTYIDEERILVHIEDRRIGRNNIALSGWVRSMDPVVTIILRNQDDEILIETTASIYRPDVVLAQARFDFPGFPGFEIYSPIDNDISGLSLHFMGSHEEELCKISWGIDSSMREQKREAYQAWQERNTISSKLKLRIGKVITDFSTRPLFSVVMPVYNVDPKWLKLAVDSIKAQIYTNWELILVNDASDRNDLNVYLEQIQESSDKITLISREVNGNISASTNDGITRAKGDFIVFMDQDDEITCNALFEFALAINKDAQTDLIYSDEDKIDENGRRYDPWFKPDWSPELLLSYNYINHLCCIRRQLVMDSEMLNSDRDGCQDFDLLLRVTPLCSKIYHVPKVLYHWRALPTSIAGQGDSKNLEFDFFNKGKTALESYLSLQKIPFNRVKRPERAVNLNAAFYTIEFPDEGPLVSIIIPSKNQKEVLESCINSIEKTTYKNYELIIADNASDDLETIRYLKTLKPNKKIKVVRIENRQERFSFSQINNDAVKYAKGEFLVFLNDDTEIINPDWLSSMLGYLQIPGVGITGAKLLYPDESIQHAGVLLRTYPHGYKDLPDHAFKNNDGAQASYGFYTDVSRNYSAVTAACLGTSRNLFDDLGGFDEENLNLAYNDIDFCLKAIEAGKRVVYVPGAELYHHESKSRGSFLNIQEVVHYKSTWRKKEDDYYNVNFSNSDLFRVSTYNTLIKGLPKLEVKVLFVSHNLNLEGAPLQLLEVILGLQKQENWNLSVLSPFDGPLKNRYLKAGVDVSILPADKEIDAFFMDLSPDVIVTNTLVTYNYILAAERLGIPSNWVIHESSHPKDFFSHIPEEEQERIFYALKVPYSLIFVAKATRSLFDDFNIMHNHCVINNGLKTDDIFAFIESNTKGEIRSKLSFSKDEIVILNLGTVCKRKGQVDFVHAAIQILDSGIKNVRFVLVGARHRDAELVYLEEILSLIEEKDYTAYFDIIDETPDTFQYFCSADLFVCSSYNESYPRVILEAMAFGLPIVSTPVFGIVEQIIEDQNCKYYHPGDLDGLVEKISEFIKEPIIMKQYGENSRAMLELITSYNEMVQEYSERIEEAIFTDLNYKS